MSEKLRFMPIIRGWMSSPLSLPLNWMTFGSGRLVTKPKSLYKKRSSQDWGDFDPDFVKFSQTSTSVLYSYSCPNCNDSI